MTAATLPRRSVDSRATARPAAADDVRRGMFLAKADVDLPDGFLRALKGATDESLGIDADLRAAAMGAFGLDAVSGAPAELAGTFHRLFGVGGKRLLRIAAIAGTPWSEIALLEAALARSLRAAGLRVPACDAALVADGASSRGVQLVDRVPGRAATHWDDDEAAMLARLEAMAAFLKGLHAIPCEGFGPLSARAPSGPAPLAGIHDRWPDFLRVRLAEHVGHCASIGALGPADAGRADAAFAELESLGAPARGSLLHGDPGPHNFVFDDATLGGVIDWEDALSGDPLFDLAALCTFQPARRHERILAAYGLDADPAAPRRFWLYFLRIALAKTAHRARFGYADRPGRPPASERIRWALEALDGLA